MYENIDIIISKAAGGDSHARIELSINLKKRQKNKMK